MSDELKKDGAEPATEKELDAATLDAAIVDQAAADRAGGEQVGGEQAGDSEPASSEQDEAGASDEQQPSRLRITIQDKPQRKRSSRRKQEAAPLTHEANEGAANESGDADEAAANPEAELATLVDSLARGNARSADCERWVYSRYGIDPHLPTVEKIRLLRRV